ncbi:MAG TPA: hypothetical protein VLY86_01615 [Methanothrix sp.]|nr:hypothetical protein [Methanothrix sp.]
MAFYADPTTVTRTDSFSTSDRYAYSWLNLSNVGATKVMWNWYSPDGNLYFTDSKIINRPLPKATWDSYPIWDGMVIMGTNAANLPGKWHVDVYVGDQKILTEQFAIG